MHADTWMLIHVLKEPKVADLVPAWITFYGIATFVSAIGAYLHARRFLKQFQYRRRMVALGEDDDLLTMDEGLIENASVEQRLDIHSRRLAKVALRIQSMYAGAVIGLRECLPLGVLQCIYASRVAERSDWAVVSLVLTVPNLDQI